MLARAEEAARDLRAAADLARLRADEAQTEALVREQIGADPELSARFAPLTGMPGVGLVVASLVRVAPVARDSGLTRGARVTAGGRGAVRRALSMAAAASQRETRFAALYRRLIEAGKPPKLALVATLRKMLTTLNAVARAGRRWSDHPAHQAAPTGSRNGR